MSELINEWMDKRILTFSGSDEIHQWPGSKRNRNCYEGPIWKQRTFSSGAGRKAPALTSRNSPWTPEEVTHWQPLSQPQKWGNQLPLKPLSSRTYCQDHCLPHHPKDASQPCKLTTQHKTECSRCGLHHKSHSTELWTQEHCCGKSHQFPLSRKKKMVTHKKMVFTFTLKSSPGKKS